MLWILQTIIKTVDLAIPERVLERVSVSHSSRQTRPRLASHRRYVQVIHARWGGEAGGSIERFPPHGGGDQLQQTL